MTSDSTSELLDAYAYWRSYGLTPLTSVNGFADLLQRGVWGALTPQQHEAMTIIYTNARRSAEMWWLGSSYLMARYAPFEPEVIMPSELLQDVHTRLHATLPLLATSTSTPATPVWGERMQLGAALCYLVHPIELDLDNIHPAPQIIVHDEISHTIIDVISALRPDIEDVQGRFHYTGSSLQVAESIVQRHNGTLEIDQSAERVRFHIALPIENISLGT
jgi:hypothetical protein